MSCFSVLVSIWEKALMEKKKIERSKSFFIVEFFKLDLLIPDFCRQIWLYLQVM
jgi:hypothetical protein